MSETKISSPWKWIILIVFGCYICSATEPTFADGPPIAWQKTFGRSDSDFGKSVQQTSDGGYVIAGYTYSFGAGGSDVYLIKTDPNGDSQWEQTFGGSSDDVSYSVQQTIDGGYIISGSTSSFGAGGSDVYLIKTEPNGSSQWQKTFGGSEGDQSYSVQQTKEGGYIIAGITDSSDPVYCDVYLIKTEPNGTLQWQKTFGGSDYDFGMSVQQTSDGGYVIAGYTYSFGAGYIDVYLIKTDPNGNRQWQKTFGGSGHEYGNSVQQTSDDGYIITGNAAPLGIMKDVYLIKTDPNGDSEWYKTFGGNRDEDGYSLEQTSDGGYIISGVTRSFGVGRSDVYLIKTEPNGSSQWQKTFGGSETDSGVSIHQTSDGGYIISGSTRSFGAGDHDIYLIKLCPEGTLSGDLNCDGIVNAKDLDILVSQWLQPRSISQPHTDIYGVGDGITDFNDFTVLGNQWQTTDPRIPDDMAYIPNGEFLMGDHFSPEGNDDELPVHAVFLDSFFMSKYEITNQQYCDYLNSAFPAQIKVDSGIVYAVSDSSNSYPYCHTHSYSTYSQIDFNDVSGTFSIKTKGGRDMSNDPMVKVSWYGSVAYCNWRSDQEGYDACYSLSTWDCDFSKNGYRLPTEAEWEYAARGGENTPYYRFPWGDTISHSQANYFSSASFSYDVSPTRGYHPDWDDGISPYTSVVGSFSANGYGLYDVTGNVREWCNDWYGSVYYSVSPYVNPIGPASGSTRVLRDGMFGFNASSCRVADRNREFPDNLFNNLGFRVVLDLQLPSPGRASDPNPANGAIGVSTSSNLSWTASPYAISYDVYFGTSNPPPFISNQTTTVFDPGTMAQNTTYYWRIDAVGNAGKTNGLVWSFTTLSSPPPPPP